MMLKRMCAALALALMISLCGHGFLMADSPKTQAVNAAAGAAAPTGSAPATAAAPTPKPAPIYKFRAVIPLKGDGAQRIEATLSEGAKAMPLTAAVDELAADGSLVRTISTTTFGADPTVSLPLPDVNTDTFVRVTIDSDPPGKDPLFRWTTLLRAQVIPLLEYKGTGTLPAPADFDAYWDRAKREVDGVEKKCEVTRLPDRDSSTALAFRVVIPAARDTKIVCWYTVPRSAFGKDGKVVKRVPATMIMPGYGAEEPMIDRSKEGIAILSVNPRNHGPSKEFWKSPVEHMLYNLDDPENYYYKLGVMDGLVAARFLFGQPEIDGKKVSMEGGSQGGYFTVAMAALEPRFACAASNVTAFSAYPEGWALALTGHHRQLAAALAKAETKEQREKMELSLAYTDGANLASRAKIPLQVNMGGQDPVCSYVGGIVVYNAIPAGVDREFNLLPDAKHEVPGAMREANARWYRKYWKE